VTGPVLLKAISLAVPTGVGIGAFDLLADPHFSSTITLGSVILALAVMIVAGAGAIRSQIARNWRDSWQAEKTLRVEKQEELARLHVRSSATKPCSARSVR
jgi:hypothetical protein